MSDLANQLKKVKEENKVAVGEMQAEIDA